MSGLSGHAIGIDVGGTKIAAGLVSFPEGKVLVRRIIPTQTELGGIGVLENVESLVRDLLEEAAAHSFPVQGIGLGVCELVGNAGALISANCLDWRSLPVVERLSQFAPTIMEADVRAAAFGEAVAGAGRPFRQFLYVTVGTGISSCLVLDGIPYRGARGASGTMASSPLPTFEPSAPSPTLEELTAGPALIQRYRAAGGEAKTGHDVLAAAAAGDPRATAVVRSGAEVLGATVGWLVNVLDPEAVIIGGGLGLSEGLFHDVMLEATLRHVWSESNRDLLILRATLGPDAGLIGAAASFLQRDSARA